MRCPELKDLPAAPAGLTGWPWTEGSTPLPPTMPDGTPWPLVSIVTPSYNQARFLEATLRSILLQGYPNLEYFVMDGGSTDGSVELIRKYAPWITQWVSEPDGGQSNAINRGMKLGSALFTGWINSDDMLYQNALATHASRVGFQPGVVYLGDCLYMDEHGRALHMHRGRVHDFEDLVHIRTVWRARERGHIVQPEVLFDRQLALDVGGVDPRNHRTMDYELWGRFFLAGAKFVYTEIPFGMFRLHAEQKTDSHWPQTKSLIATAEKLVAQANHMPEAERAAMVAELRAYQHDYWRATGPLARMGLPENVVLPLRQAKARLRRRAAALIRGRSEGA